MTADVRRKPRRVWTAIGAALALAGATVFVELVTGAAPAGAVGPAPASGVDITAHLSNRCLNVAHASLADKAPVIQYTCVGAANERWRAVPQDDGSYQLVAEHSGKCLNVAGASTGDSAPVVQYRCTGTALNERWVPVQLASSREFTLVAEHSGKCLNVLHGSTADNAPVGQYRCTGTAGNERWYSGAKFAEGGLIPNTPPVAQQATAGAPITVAYVNQLGTAQVATTVLTPGTDLAWTALPQSQRLSGRLGLVSGGGRQQVLAAGIERNVWGLDLSRPATSRAWIHTGEAGVLSSGFTVAPWGATASVVIAGQGGQRLLLDDGAHVPFLSWREQVGIRFASGVAAAAAPLGTQLFAIDSDTLNLVTATFGLDRQVSTPTTVGTAAFLQGKPAALVLPGFHYLVAARSNTGDNNIMVKWQDPLTGAWPANYTTVRGADAAGDPQLVLDPSTRGRVAIVVRDTTGGIRVAEETAIGSRVFGPWTTVTTGAVADPAVFTFTGLGGQSSWGFAVRSANDAISVFSAAGGVFTRTP